MHAACMYRNSQSTLLLWKPTLAKQKQLARKMNEIQSPHSLPTYPPFSTDWTRQPQVLDSWDVELEAATAMGMCRWRIILRNLLRM